jgi:hypothetical protein
VGLVKYGTDINSLVVDRWWYRAHDLYEAYDTRQVFRDPEIVTVNGQQVAVPHVGVHTVLSPWYLKGRFMSPPFTVRELPALLARILYYGLARSLVALRLLSLSKAFPARRMDAQRAAGGQGRPRPYERPGPPGGQHRAVSGGGFFSRLSSFLANLFRSINYRHLPARCCPAPR